MSQSSTVQVGLVVNGQPRTVTADIETTLLEVLRNQLELKGTRFGCGLEQCGSCMVLVDGEPLRACGRAVATLAGAQIITIEGLSLCLRGETPEQNDHGTPQPSDLHPLQRAFIDEQAGQCGYCLSGILVSAAALLSRNLQPSRADIVAALDAHLCRCGAHTRIIRAVDKAAALLRGEVSR